ncbi:MAG: hypothetical protein ACREF7_03340 [Candidatus Saccharimonadales bacterium]
MNDYRQIKITIPSWASWLFIIISICLIPWTIYLSFALPAHHLSHNWDMTWVGLDSALIGSLLATAILAKLKSIYMVVTAVVTATLFITDAWFDILSYRPGTHGFDEALIMAIVGEIPMAFMSLLLAIHGLRRLHGKAEGD